MTASAATAAPQRIDYASTLDKRTKMLILVGVLLGLFLSALDQTIVSTALPSIIKDLQGIDMLAWVTTAYLLASTTMVPIYGKLSDIYGRKIVVLSGIVIFLLGSMLCGIAQNMVMLVLFRGIQGLGAAALTSTAFAIPADLFAPAERARYQGIFGAVFGLSSVIGPYLGGLLTDSLSWHWVFYVNVPFGIVALAFIIAKMPKLDSGIKSKIDWLGAGTLVLFVVPLLLGLTLDKTNYAWDSATILSLFATAAVGLGLFLWVELRSPSPIIPLNLFRNRTYALIAIISPLVGASLFASIVFLSIFTVNVLGVSATDAGTALIPLTLSMVIGSIFVSMLVQRLGRYKVPILVGLATLGVGFWWLSTLDVNSTLNDVRLRMVVLGLGLAPALPLLNLAMQNAIPFQFMGTATASRQFYQQLGQAMGTAVLGAMLTTGLTSAITANLEPIKASLPAEMQAQFDPSQFRNGGSEGAGGEQISVSERIAQGIRDGFATQRDLITRAIRDNDQQAIQTLLTDSRTPEQLRETLQAGGIAATVDNQFAEQQALIEKALQDNDQTAIKALLANPRTPEQLKTTLQSGGIAAAVHGQVLAQEKQVDAALRKGPDGLKALLTDASLPQPLKDGLAKIPAVALRTPQGIEGVVAQFNKNLEAQEPVLVQQITSTTLSQITKAMDEQKPAVVQQATDAALNAVNQALDTAEQEALTKGAETGRQIDAAIKQSFASSITDLYRYCIPVVALAFLLALFVPELPLRRSNSDHGPVIAAIE